MTTPKMEQEIAQYSFWEAIGADDLVATEIRQSYLEFEDAAPFDRIGTDSCIDDVFWEKTFPESRDSELPFQIEVAYLSHLMPEMFGFHPGLDKTLISWVTRDVHDVISEAFDSMSPTTKALVTGKATINEILDGFFTPDVIVKAKALNDPSTRMGVNGIVKVLISGESVALVNGML